MRPDSIRARKPRISGDIRPIPSSLLVIESWVLPLFQPCYSTGLQCIYWLPAVVRCFPLFELSTLSISPLGGSAISSRGRSGIVQCREQWRLQELVGTKPRQSRGRALQGFEVCSSMGLSESLQDFFSYPSVAAVGSSPAQLLHSADLGKSRYLSSSYAAGLSEGTHHSAEIRTRIQAVVVGQDCMAPASPRAGRRPPNVLHAESGQVTRSSSDTQEPTLRTSARRLWAHKRYVRNWPEADEPG